MQLFRSQVLAELNNPFGETFRWYPRGIHALVATLATLVVGALALLLNLEYTEKITLRGWTQSQSKPTVVFAERSARVEAVLVTPGQRVLRGAALIKLDYASYTLGQRSLVISERERLLARRSNLLQQLELFKHYRAALDAKAVVNHESAHQRLEMLLEELQLAQDQVELARKERERIAVLNQNGWVSQREAAGAYEHLLSMEQRVLNRRGQVSGAEEAARLAKVQTELGKAESALELARFHERLLAVDEEIERQLESEHGVVVAPRDGIVGDLIAESGMQVGPETGLMTLIDEGGATWVEFAVPSKAMAYVAVGTPVHLRFEAFPANEFGLGYGEVRSKADAARAHSGEMIFTAKVEVLKAPINTREMANGVGVLGDLQLRKQVIWRRLLTPLLEAWARV